MFFYCDAWDVACNVTSWVHKVLISIKDAFKCRFQRRIFHLSQCMIIKGRWWSLLWLVLWVCIDLSHRTRSNLDITTTTTSGRLVHCLTSNVRRHDVQVAEQFNIHHVRRGGWTPFPTAWIFSSVLHFPHLTTTPTRVMLERQTPS